MKIDEHLHRVYIILEKKKKKKKNSLLHLLENQFRAKPKVSKRLKRKKKKPENQVTPLIQRIFHPQHPPPRLVQNPSIKQNSHPRGEHQDCASVKRITREQPCPSTP